MIKYIERNCRLGLLNIAPIAFLEGGLGLNDNEKKLAEYLSSSWGLSSVHVIDELYDNPRKLAAISFLDIKTIVIGTTGVYRDDLNFLIDFFKTLEIKTIKNVIFAVSAEDVLYKEAIEFKKDFPDCTFFKLTYADDEEYIIHKIEF